MNFIENIAGVICKSIFPIKEEVFFGNPNSSVAVCTLSSINLLKDIANSNLISRLALVGRLLSENRGIDSLVNYVISNKNIKTIIICGKETSGHRSGHSLLNLHKNGIDHKGRIIGSSSPDPVLTITESNVTQFQKQVRLVDHIGETSISRIELAINSLVQT